MSLPNPDWDQDGMFQPQMENDVKTLQLTTKAYCAGIVLNSKGICIQAAPILKWMIGKGEAWIKHHCNKHHIRIQEVAETDAKGRAV